MLDAITESKTALHPRCEDRLKSAQQRQKMDVQPAKLVVAIMRSFRRGEALTVLPTATIGSFPQTAEVRRARAAYRSGKMARTEYEALLRAEVERAIRFQEEIGLDVPVHGEFERNDMVEPN